MTIERIQPNLYRFRVPFDRTGTVFLYLVTGDRIALIDTGAFDSPETVLEPALAQIHLSLADVDCILNTHAHLDHSGGNMEVRRRSKAKIHVHQLDLPMAESNAVQVEFHVGPLRTLEFPPEAIKARTEHVLKATRESRRAPMCRSPTGILLTSERGFACAFFTAPDTPRAMWCITGSRRGFFSRQTLFRDRAPAPEAIPTISMR